MKNIKSFKAFNESMSYDNEDFNEVIIKNMMSDDFKTKRIWSMVSDVYVRIKNKLPELVPSFISDILNKDNTLKVALKYALQANSDGSLQDVCDELIEMRNEEKSIKNIINLRVKNNVQAEDLKDILSSKPWFSRVKIKGHNLIVDIKNHTIDEIKSLFRTLPFGVEII